jgi:hypothetical protein
MRRTTDKIDDLARQAFASEPGANASFANRMRLRLAGERAAVTRRNTRILVSSIITAVAASIVILLVFTVDWSRPVANSTARANSPTNEVSAPKDGKPGEHAQPRPEVKPEPRPPANAPNEETPKVPDVPKPEVKPEPKPEVKPEPRPEVKPESKPEEKPAKPDEVEKPKEEPKTDVKPVERHELGAVVAFEKAARAKIRYGDAETWRDLTPGEKLLSGAQLQASAAVDFSIGKAVLRFDGEITLEESSIELRKDSLYADNFALETKLVITAGELRAELSGVAVFDISASGLRMDVLHGGVETARGAVTEDVSATLTKSRLSKRGLVRSALAKILKGVPARAIMREDFEKEPKGGLYGGKLKSGIAISQGGNDSIAFKFEPVHALLPGEVIRVHFRVSKAKTLLIQMFDEKKNDNFGHEVSSWKNGEWQTFEFKPSAMLDRESGKVRPQAGTEFVNFQFRIEGPEEALLEIDWIEVVRIEE